jgi:hypothetical protein
VYLKRIETPQANVTWRFRGEQAGFFGTQLLITPHGLDFEYFATGGRLKMALLPDLDLRRAHLSGTINDPGQDLSPRIIELFKQSPGAYLRLLFRQFEGWLKKDLAAINSVLRRLKERRLLGVAV